MINEMVAFAICSFTAIWFFTQYPSSVAGCNPSSKDYVGPSILGDWSYGIHQFHQSRLTDEICHLHRDTRNVAREQSLAADLNQSAIGLEQWLVPNQTSPSMGAQRNEQLLHLRERILQQINDLVVMKPPPDLLVILRDF